MLPAPRRTIRHSTRASVEMENERKNKSEEESQRRGIRKEREKREKRRDATRSEEKRKTHEPALPGSKSKVPPQEVSASWLGDCWGSQGPAGMEAEKKRNEKGSVLVRRKVDDAAKGSSTHWDLEDRRNHSSIGRSCYSILGSRRAGRGAWAALMRRGS